MYMPPLCGIKVCSNMNQWPWSHYYENRRFRFIYGPKRRSVDLEIDAYEWKWLLAILRIMYRHLDRLQFILMQIIDLWPHILAKMLIFGQFLARNWSLQAPVSGVRVLERSESSTWLSVIAPKAIQLCFDPIKGYFGGLLMQINDHFRPKSC